MSFNIYATEGSCNPAILALVINPKQRSDIAKYKIRDIRNPATPAFPTSELFLARADIITAPSTPKKQKRVIIIVDFI